jgi:hypothetical protein
MFCASLCPSSGEQEEDFLKLLFDVEQQLSKSAHCLHHGSTQPRPAQPRIFTLSFNQSCYCSPDDGHDDAQNMLRLI